ncbi:hypothetical protein [Kribbella amoyensis]|uniref:hypothetical protein n=1 Tax=Kribbella amoyensis TaxID=996641 RepID=UPI00192E1B4F|nr:hypothetical protein [Kribbella amoyensis]
MAGRSYLLTVEQFADVIAQETRRPPGGEFADSIAAAIDELADRQVLGPDRYETLTLLGEQDGVPLVTATHADPSSLPSAVPSATYLWWIGTGLRESHGWSSEQIAAYLLTAPAVRAGWTADELVTLAAGELPTLRP